MMLRRLAVIICSLLLASLVHAQDAAPLLAWVMARVAASPLSLNPVLHLPLDGSLVDLAGNAQAVWSNTAEYGDGPWEGTQCAVFRYGQYIDTQWGMGLYPYNTNGWTIATWYNVAPTNRFVVFGRQSADIPSGVSGRLIAVSFNCPLSSSITPAISLAGNGVNKALRLDKGIWMHMALVWNGSSCMLYSNSVYAAEVSAGATANSFQQPLLLGRLGYDPTLAKPYFGKVAHFMVFDRALTQEEITQIYEWRGNP